MEGATDRYECMYTPEPVEITGMLESPAWDRAENLAFHVPVTGATPISRTEARMLWDDSYLYVGFRAYDKDIWSYLTERDSPTCNEDVLEIFLKTDPQAEPYVNFEINALGTIYDAYNLKRNAGGPDYHRWRRWNIEGLKHAIFVKGEINNPDVIDEYWQLEVAIPFAGLPKLDGKAPTPGDEWLFHLSRYDYSIHLPDGVELSSTARLTEEKFHKYEDWQRLAFVR